MFHLQFLHAQKEAPNVHLIIFMKLQFNAILIIINNKCISVYEIQYFLHINITKLIRKFIKQENSYQIYQWSSKEPRFHDFSEELMLLMSEHSEQKFQHKVQCVGKFARFSDCTQQTSITVHWSRTCLSIPRMPGLVGIQTSRALLNTSTHVIIQFS